MENLTTLGVASSLGCPRTEPAQGPSAVRSSLMFRERLAHHAIRLEWDKIISTDAAHGNLQAIANIGRQISRWTGDLLTQRRSFLTIGGDHCCAMGTWSGAASGLDTGQSFGLIWIDAHLDLHNFVSSPSGNIHGMPLAALLGHSDRQLKQIYGDGPILDASNISIVGARSYEIEELQLLTELTLTCYHGQSIANHGGLTQVLAEASNKLQKTTDRFGISIDLDAVDPIDAPAVSTPEPSGIRGSELVEALHQFNGNQQLAGIEIAEFAPGLDKQHKTLKLIGDIIAAVYAPTIIG